MSIQSISLWKLAYCILYTEDSLHVSRILDQAQVMGWNSKGQTPLQTLRAELRRHSKKVQGKQAHFENLGQAIWRLTKWGKENPPKGTEQIISDGTPFSILETQSELYQNIERYIEGIERNVIELADVTAERQLFYSAGQHHFVPLRWALSKGWKWGARRAYPSPKEVSDRVGSLGLVKDDRPLLYTRLTQWLHECSKGSDTSELLHGDAIETRFQIFVKKADVDAGHITPYVESKQIQSMDSLMTLESVQTCIQSFQPSWVVDDTALRRVLLAWNSTSNKFVLLSGLTGIGKSNLVWNIAASVLQSAGLSKEQHRLLVSVQTNFRDPSLLFGYVNTFASPPVFVRGLLTDFLLRAHRNPSQPFFLVLDEINLAKMEQYLAPWISSVEVDGPLIFHTFPEMVSGVPPFIARWPNNIWVAGTMNFERGAHRPPDKVLDRVHSIELWDVEIEAWFDKRTEIPHTVRIALCELYDILRPTRCHFGYRSLESMTQYIQAGLVMGCNEATLLDEAIVSKVLPKLKGDQSIWTAERVDSLEDLFRASKFSLCIEQLQRIRQQIRQFGLVQPWA